MKKLMSILLVIVLLVSMLPLSVISASAQTVLVPNAEIEISGYEVVLEFTPEKSGVYVLESFSEDDTACVLYDADENFIAENDDYNDRNFKLACNLNAGQTYLYYVSEYSGSYFEATVELYETVGVESLEVVSMPYKNEYELKDTDPIELSGLELKATMSDGEIIYWSYDDSYDWYLGECEIDYDVDVDVDTCIITVVFYAGNAQVSFDLTLIESPIKSIEVISDYKLEYYQNTYGYMEEVSGQFEYYYDIPDDLEIRINYKDGTSKTALIEDEVDGERFYCYDDQWDNPWGLGENIVYIDYCGFKTELYVTILESPIEKITVNSSPNRKYIFGDPNWGDMSDNYYTIYPDDLTGLSFTAEFYDGTKKTFNDKDINMKEQTIAGSHYNLEAFDFGYVYEPGTLPMYMTYMGKTFSYDIEVVENPIASVEVVKDPYVVECESGYAPNFYGMQVKINYKDGTNKLLTLTKDTEKSVRFYFIEHDVVFVVDGIEILIERDVQFGSDAPVGGYFISNMGVKCEYNGIKFGERKEIESAEYKNVSLDVDGMSAVFTYADGTKESFDFEVLYKYGDEDDVEAVVKTHKGLTNCFVSKLYDDNDKFIGYNVFMLGKDTEILSTNDVAIEGDVTGDGEVSIMDATAIQLHLAQIEIIDDSVLEFADTYNDGIVSVMDVTQIQLFLAQIIESI